MKLSAVTFLPLTTIEALAVCLLVPIPGLSSSCESPPIRNMFIKQNKMQQQILYSSCVKHYDDKIIKISVTIKNETVHNFSYNIACRQTDTKMDCATAQSDQSSQGNMSVAKDS